MYKNQFKIIHLVKKKLRLVNINKKWRLKWIKLIKRRKWKKKCKIMNNRKTKFKVSKIFKIKNKKKNNSNNIMNK